MPPDEISDALLADVAKNELGIETMEPRNMDSLDFRDVSVVGLKKALRAAYDAGRSAVIEERLQAGETHKPRNRF
jgi:hypothetical protein